MLLDLKKELKDGEAWIIYGVHRDCGNVGLSGFGDSAWSLPLFCAAVDLLFGLSA